MIHIHKKPDAVWLEFSTGGKVNALLNLTEIVNARSGIISRNMREALDEMIEGARSELQLQITEVDPQQSIRSLAQATAENIMRQTPTTHMTQQTGRAVRHGEGTWVEPDLTQPEKSGGPVNYYLVNVSNPNQGAIAYQAECGDIIEALGMNFNEGCAFKALWRSAAARTLGKKKDGGDAKYDAEKVIFYGRRILSCITGEKS